MVSERLKSSLIFVLVLLLGIGLASFLYFYQIFYKADCFLPGVRIGAVSLAGYSKGEAAAIIRKHIEQLYNAPIIFYRDNYIYNTKLADLCGEIDIKRLLAEVEEKERKRSLLSKISNMDGLKVINYPVKVSYDQNARTKLCEVWNKELGVEAVNARLDMDLEKGLVVLPSKLGSKVNEAATFSGLPQELKGFESLKIPITMAVVHPEVEEDALQNMGEIAAFSTWFNAGDINRSNNLYLATSSINGSMLDPGEVFSFNHRVGERVVEAGYRDALVIVGNKFEPGLGGGVCQVSSTLYNAILLAGLPIIERHNHALTVAYVPVGRDATVVYGLQDFKFKNTTGHPLYIRALARGGRLQINVYGNIAAKKRVELTTVIDQTIAFKESRQVDASLPPGQEKVDHVGFPGYVSRTFRSYLDQEGKVIEKEKLSTDYYKPLDKLILTGSEAASENPAIEPAGEPAAEVPGEKPAEPTSNNEPLPQETVPLDQSPPEVGI
ncbi:MAG: VanW family protein [Syntrophomonadaceae bacterium]|nr:VanW family protein [Syntrophomonadaceae bacterium]